MEQPRFVLSIIWSVYSVLHFDYTGMYITKMVRAHSRASDDSDLTGQATGTFFMIYNINGIAGNLIAIIYLYTGGTIEVMCWIMFLVACSGSFMMCFASRLPGPVLAEDSISAKGADEINETSALRKAKMTMELDEDEDGIDILEQQPPTSPIKWTTRSFLNNFLLKRETLLLTPYFIYQGINTSFCFGNFPTYVTLVTDRGTSNPTILAANIAFIFLGYGCGSIIGSYVWGKLYDLFRSRLYPLLVSHGLLIVVTYSIIIAVVTLPVGYPIGVFPLLLLSSFLLGSIDFLANAVANNSCTKMFSSDIVSVAFAWYRVCFCVGVSVPAIISSSLPEIKYFDDLSATEFQRYAWLLIVVLNIFMAFFSILCGLRLDRLMK